MAAGTSSPAGDGAGSGIGVCCSGGGIRSAAFNLGALQSLDAAGVLRRADHLSAVSGGAFIASAYAVTSRYSDPDLLARTPAFAPGTPEESWVRNHCSYLTNGFVDTVRVLAVALVGLLANLVFFTALLWTVARPLGWFYGWWQPGLRVPAACDPARSATAAVAAGCFATAEVTGLGPWGVTAGALAAAGLVIALLVRMFHPRWPVRPVLGRMALLLVAAAAGVALVTVALPLAVVLVRNVLGDTPGTGPMGASTAAASSTDKGSANLGVIAGLGGLATVMGVMVRLAVPLHRAAIAGARAVGRARRWGERLSRGLWRVGEVVLGALIGPLALTAGALLVLNGGAQARSPSRGELGLWGVMFGLTVAMCWWADVTSWSMHPFFKRRIARTFAVKRMPDPAAGREGRAVPLPYELPLRLSAFAPERFPGSTPGHPAFPELSVCAAVNVSDEGATPPGRDSLSFVFRPSSIGCHPSRVVVPRAVSGWRHVLDPSAAGRETELFGPIVLDTTTYEERVRTRRSLDVTLSAAVAVSAAGLAPAMGRMTRPSLRFLLALANLRLGVWLPNPALVRDTRRRPPARPRQPRLLFEALGWHRVRSPFLYVTDGGHVENLGLVELLRQRCTTIVCLDASGDPPDRASALGEALAAAADELDVSVDIDPAEVCTIAGGFNVRDHVTATIRYPDGTRGLLVYGKAVVTAGAPWDVRAYASKDPLFPSHATADQLYSGETFDAYQALGRHVGRACADEVTGWEAGRRRAPRPAAVAPPGAATVTARPGPGPWVAGVGDVAAAATELSRSDLGGGLRSPGTTDRR